MQPFGDFLHAEVFRHHVTEQDQPLLLPDRSRVEQVLQIAASLSRLTADSDVERGAERRNTR